MTIFCFEGVWLKRPPFYFGIKLVKLFGHLIYLGFSNTSAYIYTLYDVELTIFLIIRSGRKKSFVVNYSRYHDRLSNFILI